MNILPEPQRQGDIKFIFGRSLPYFWRLAISIFMIAAGLLLQLYVNFILGLFCLFVGTALILIRGYQVKPVLKKGSEKWNQVTPDEYTKVKLKAQDLRRWDLDSFDITNRLGCAVLFLVAAFCWGMWFFVVYFLKSPKLAGYWVVDCAVVILPHWITGVRDYLKKDKLVIKIELLEKIMGLLSTPSDIQVLPMLSTEETTESNLVPADARLLVRLLNTPDYFLGLQVQISINDVQGTSYPYLYAVLIFKKEAGILEKKKNFFQSPPPNVVFEPVGAGDVDVMVIRQKTTKSSGYATNFNQARLILQTALDLSRQICSDNK